MVHTFSLISIFFDGNIKDAGCYLEQDGELHETRPLY